MKEAFAWWPYISNVISRYQRDKQRNDLDRVELLQVAAVEFAKSKAMDKDDGGDRIRLVELVYWRRGYSLTRAAMEIPISYTTARRWKYDFFCDVAQALGLYDPPE